MCKAQICEDFAVAMDQQETSGTPTTTHVKIPSGYIPGPSHPTFSQVEEMEMKQNERGGQLIQRQSLCSVQCKMLNELQATTIQDFNQVTRGFAKLHKQYTTVVPTLKDELKASQDELKASQDKLHTSQGQLNACQDDLYVLG